MFRGKSRGDAAVNSSASEDAVESERANEEEFWLIRRRVRTPSKASERTSERASNQRRYADQ